MNIRIANLSRRRALWLVWAALAVALASGDAPAAPPVSGRLLARDQIARLGLVRSWFAQVNVDPGRSRVERAILSGNQLLVLTNAGMLQAIDANTGATMWAASFGDPKYPSLGPAANDQFVAILNGSMLYIVDRLTGKTIDHTTGKPTTVRKVSGPPGAAPALSNSYCFVPMITGRVEGYPVSEDSGLPMWFYGSAGAAMVAPATTAQSVVWSTYDGHINVGNSLNAGMRFRLETGSEIIASPASRGSMIYIGTVEGELIAVDELTGVQPWRFAAGYAIERAPAAVGGRVFVTSAQPALSAVDAVTGQSQWIAPRIAQFAAASRERVYAIDSTDSLVALNAANGVTVGRIPSDGVSRALVNDQTDRIYLVSPSGMVQCMHEIGLEQPISHQPLAVAPPAGPGGAQPPATPGAPATPTGPGAQPTPPPDANPFGAPGKMDDNPFGAGGGAPGGNTPAAGKADDIPFGGAAGGATQGGGAAGGAAGGTTGGAAGGASDNPFGAGAGGASDNPFGR